MSPNGGGMLRETTAAVGASSTNLKSYIQDLKKVAQSNKQKRVANLNHVSAVTP